MAVLTDQESIRMSRGLETDSIPINYSKVQIKTALQAVEDWFDKPAVKAVLSADIDTATAPFVFTNAQKKKLIKRWLRFRFDKE